VLLGAVSFSGQIPVLLFAAFGGVVADKYNRHRILVATQTTAMILAFVLASATLAGAVQVWHVFALSALLGLTNAFDIPARQAFVVNMVGREDIINAVALNSTIFNGARIVGPAAAGVLVAAIGEGWCFFANGVSYLAVIVGLLLMKVDTRYRAPTVGSAASGIVEGFRYAGQKRPVRALLLMLGMNSLLGMPYVVLMPIFADQILHGGARGLGFLMGASGVGALSGALSLARRQGLRGLGRWIALATAGFGLSLILFSQSRVFWLSAALLVPVGFCMIILMASSNTLIQAMVPDTMRGRVMAVYSMMFMGMAPFGALLSGALAHSLGAPATVAMGGSVCIVGALFFWLRLPSLRVEAREMIVAIQATAGEPAEAATGAGSTLARQSK
jgi:MFS family permease